MTENNHDDEPVLFRALANKMGYIYHDGVYRQFFGLSPEVTCVAWNAISKPTVHAKLLPKHLLWALLFLKQYSNEGVLSSIVRTTPKTYRKWIWIVIEGLSSRYPNTVSKLLIILIYLLF